jgi:hypothetical protein
VKFWLGVLFSILVISPIPEVFAVIDTEVDVVETKVIDVPSVYDSTPTPVIDSMIDWEEQDRQNECLWLYLQQLGWEITFDNVILAGSWADANGGACLLIGEDDE